MELQFENGNWINIYDINSLDMRDNLLLNNNDPWRIKNFIVNCEDDSRKKLFLDRLYNEWQTHFEDYLVTLMGTNQGHEDTFKDTLFRLNNNIYRIKELKDDKDMMKLKVMLCPTETDFETLKFFAEPVILYDWLEPGKSRKKIQKLVPQCIYDKQISKEVLEFVIDTNGYYISNRYMLKFCPELQYIQDKEGRKDTA